MGSQMIIERFQHHKTKEHSLFSSNGKIICILISTLSFECLLVSLTLHFDFTITISNAFFKLICIMLYSIISRILYWTNKAKQRQQKEKILEYVQKWVWFVNKFHNILRYNLMSKLSLRANTLFYDFASLYYVWVMILKLLVMYFWFLVLACIFFSLDGVISKLTSASVILFAWEHRLHANNNSRDQCILQ